ncbi:MAG: DEAD/DEAH box helicase family protein [Candidatus Portnoybacteria bacterium]|nr:DEAD/DEAH box helicase family protein [Candidatus Portnoybacteria bacterium]MDD4982685.1 DEAD/DEAH box helicase family protein [Candidatus Portnoybacteria bacterium]
MPQFKIHAPYKPTGDQPNAINKLVKNLNAGAKHQVLLGVTGSGKTFTMANVIEKVQKPTLIISHNKTLAAQLYQEFKEFFPNNSVNYFVSYYDYYQPEAYIPTTDTYIQKDAKINEELDRLRHAATQSLLTREDAIVVASVSCIYNIGSPGDYQGLSVEIKQGQEISRQVFLRQLAALQYTRSDIDFKRSTYRVRGNIVEIWLATGELTIKAEFEAHKITRISAKPLRSLKDIFAGQDEQINSARIYPAKFWVSPQKKIDASIANIRAELDEQLKRLGKDGKSLEAERLSRRTNYDLEMLKEVGYCHGIENYSRHLELRQGGTAPSTLLDYYPNDFLMIIDESHMSVPQIGAMYEGDRSRKQTLIDFGFRLPSALDNRPLKFPEFEKKISQVIYTSATPGKYETAKTQAVNCKPFSSVIPAPHQVRGKLEAGIQAQISKSGSRVTRLDSHARRARRVTRDDK